MPGMRVAKPEIDEQRVTREWGPSVRNESAKPVTEVVKIRKEWRYRIRIDDSVSMNGIKGAALIPYIENAIEAGTGWSFSATQVLEKDLTVDVFARHGGNSVITWKPLICNGVLETGPGQPDVPFSIEAGYTFDFDVELKLLT